MINEHDTIQHIYLLAKKASIRPCSGADLFSIEKELENTIGDFRSHREELRAIKNIEAESFEFRKSILLAKLEIKRSLDSHIAAKSLIAQIYSSIQLGEAKPIDIDGLDKCNSLGFTDLKLIFANKNIEHKQHGEQYYTKFAIFFFLILLLVTTFFDLWARTDRN